MRRLRRTGVGPPRDVVKTDEEWRRQLSPEQYRVLRSGGTERPFSGANVHPSAQPGSFSCAGCGARLFDARAQFDSGTGWPSFGHALQGAVELRRDFSLGWPRIEARCRRCGGHLGHVFGDGPRPTGKRYCINSAALEGNSHGVPGERSGHNLDERATDLAHTDG
ncbi:MAG: peptide-methionine (R)-S-oxide reductase MsrB [Candidatus Dormibacteria bacterium]